jgi:hypothetical protein
VLEAECRGWAAGQAEVLKGGGRESSRRASGLRRWEGALYLLRKKTGNY